MDRFQQRQKFFRTMRFDKDACPELIDRLWNEPDRLILQGEQLKKKQCVRTTVLFESAVDVYVVKRHLERSWRHIVKQWFSRSRAERCWRDTWFLIENGYPTPQPIAFREERFGALRGNSYYVYQYVAGRTLREIAAPLKNQRKLRDYVRQLCGIWSLHQRLQVNLTDGHPENIVIAPSGKLWIIDLDKLQYLQGVPKSVQNRELERSFMATLRGVFGDAGVLKYGQEKIAEVLALSSQPGRQRAA